MAAASPDEATGQVSRVVDGNNEFNPADWWSGQIPAGVCVKGESAPVAAPVVSTSSGGSFVGSWKSNKYHYPSCSAAKKISAANLRDLRQLG